MSYEHLHAQITESKFQGDLRKEKNIQVGVISPKNLSVEYFFSPSISFSISFGTMNRITEKENIYPSISSILHTKEVIGVKGTTGRAVFSYYPFQNNGFFISGFLGKTPGFFRENSDIFLLDSSGSISPALPYGQRVEQIPSPYIGFGTGYKHIFSNGIFLGIDAGFNHIPGRIQKKYSIFPDASTFFSGSNSRITEYYLIRKQNEMDSYKPKKNFLQIHVSFGIAF